MPSHAVVSPSDTNFEVGGNKEGMAKGEQEQEVETREEPRESCACRRTLLAPLENQETPTQHKLEGTNPTRVYIHYRLYSVCVCYVLCTL